MQPPEMINAGESVLKRWEPEWAHALTSAVTASLPEIRRVMAWATDGYDLAAARGFLATAAAEWEGGTAFHYAVFSTVGDLVGSSGLLARVGPGSLEIGYWIHSHHTGRGHATRTATSLAQVGLSLPGIGRVVITHDAANPGCGAVAARAGFTEVSRSAREPRAPGDSGVEVTWERHRTGPSPHVPSRAG